MDVAYGLFFNMMHSKMMFFSYRLYIVITSLSLLSENSFLVYKMIDTRSDKLKFVYIPNGSACQIWL